MKLARISFVAAVLSAAFWAAKAVAIGVAGGNDLSRLESPFFLIGFGFQVLALLALVLWWTRRRHVAVRAASMVGSIVATFVVISAFEAVLELVKPADAGWVWVEVNLWIVAAVLLTLTWRAASAARQSGTARGWAVASDFR